MAQPYRRRRCGEILPLYVSIFSTLSLACSVPKIVNFHDTDVLVVVFVLFVVFLEWVKGLPYLPAYVVVLVSTSQATREILGRKYLVSGCELLAMLKVKDRIA